MPPLKYCGRYSLPSGPSSQPSTRRKTRKSPDGVRATCSLPPERYFRPEPVLVLKIHVTTPLSATSSVWVGLSISTTCPLADRALGRRPASTWDHVAGPHTPSRCRPATFWIAHTACRVRSPYWPSTAPSQ